MFTLFVLFVIVQITVSSPHQSYGNIAFPTESSQMISNEETPPSCQTYVSEPCPDKDHSLVSNSDLKYLIEDMTAKLHIQEKIINSYYSKAENILEQYSEDLEEIRVLLEDRPEHMLHILDEMADLRQKLEPDVQRITAQLEEFDIRDEKYEDIAERYFAMLKQLGKNRKICQINCEDYDIEPRFSQKIVREPPIPSKYTVNKEQSCFRLKGLDEYLTAKLSQFQEEYGQVLLSELETRDEMYGQKLTELKMNLKQAAVKQFGMTMYEVLSLRDDYYHLVQDFKNSNISAELVNIEQNFGEIKLLLIGLKRDIEKYRHYCMNCNSNQRRVKRDVLETRHDAYNIHDSDLSIENKSDAGLNIVDELLKAKIDAIKEMIKTNITDMFEKLDEDFNTPDVIDSYVMKLKPIQEDIEHEIRIEQQALYNLWNMIPNSSTGEILVVSKKSKQMIQNLEAAKQYIDKFI